MSFLDRLGDSNVIHPFIHILAYLNDEDINNLKVIEELQNNIVLAENSDLYWKERVEHSFCLYLKDQSDDTWKNIYSCLTIQRRLENNSSHLFRYAVNENNHALLGVLLDGYGDDNSSGFVHMINIIFIDNIRWIKLKVVDKFLEDRRINPLYLGDRIIENIFCRADTDIFNRLMKCSKVTEVISIDQIINLAISYDNINKRIDPTLLNYILNYSKENNQNNILDQTI